MQYEQSDVDAVDEEEFKRLSAEEVRTLRRNSPQFSPWFVVGLQVFVGFVVAVVAWVVGGSRGVGLSAAYGALAVVVPAAVFARGLVRQRLAPSTGAALGGFFVWEVVKVLLTVVLLFCAPKAVEDLNWLALLAGFVVTMKAYWLAVWLQSMRQKSVAKI